jgi:hypothetical protein
MIDERWKECKHHHDGCACREHAWAEQVARLKFELDVEKSNYECIKGEFNRAVALAQEHCPKPVLGQAWLTDGIPLLAERAKRAEAEVARLKGETYCAYCGERFPLDAPDSCEQIGNHIQVCPKHPMRAVEAERDAALAEVERIRTEPTVAQVRAEMVGKIIAMINECYAAQDRGFNPIRAEHVIALNRALEVVRWADVERLKANPMPTDYDRSIHANPDAHAWAKLFCETFPGSDEGLMIGWFANAMMAMHDHIKQTDLVVKEEPIKKEHGNED